MKVVVVHNGKSGSALPIAEIRTKCEAAGIEVTDAVAVGSDLERDLHPHLADGRTILAIGGDGTVSAVAGLVAHTDATLVPIPGGTLNNFTKDLGVPQDIDEALARAASTSARQVDIASVNDVYFVNNSSIGLYSTTLRERQSLESLHGKWSSAAIATVKAFWRFKSYRVEAEGMEFTTPIIFVGNNRYPVDGFDGGFRRERLDEGTLSMFVVAGKRRWSMFKLGLHLVFVRSLKHASDFEDHYGTEFTIETKRTFVSVSHDGELTSLATPLRYRIHPGVLRVI